MKARTLAVALPLCALLLAPAHALADASESQPRAAITVNDYEAGKKAIEAKDWAGAIAALDKAAAKDPKDADIQNLLGYANRKRGNLDAAFKHYDRALELNPKHLGAHEYIGEAYLMAGKPAKAKEHLALLDKYCPAKCEERDDLKKAIADYEKKPREATTCPWRRRSVPSG
jgi:Flp pilus assembly protein TadD